MDLTLDTAHDFMGGWVNRRTTVTATDGSQMEREMRGVIAAVTSDHQRKRITFRLEECVHWQNGETATGKKTECDVSITLPHYTVKPGDAGGVVLTSQAYGRVTVVPPQHPGPAPLAAMVADEAHI